MTATEITTNITSSKGQFVKACWKSFPKTSAQHKGVTLEKRTSAVVRAGIDFANLSTVKEGIATGERGEVQSLPWGEWKDFPYVIEHKGTEYIRLYPSPAPNHVPTCFYFVDGVQVAKEVFASFLTPSDAKKLLSTDKEDKPECFTIKAENVLGTDEMI